MLQFTDISLGGAGDLHCRRCRGQQPGDVRDHDAICRDVDAAIAAWESGPGPNLLLTGTEPLRYPRLDELLTRAVGAGAQRLCLDSDCHGMTPQSAGQLLRDGVRQIRTTLLGSDARRHDALLGRPGAFAATMAGMTAFAEAAQESETTVHLETRVAACRHNVHDLPEIVTASARAGAHSVRLVVEDAGLDLRSAAPWIEAACDSGIVSTIWVEVEGVPYGMASGWELHLAPMYRQVEGAKAERCRTCALADVCPGAIQGASQSVLGSFTPPPQAERMRVDIQRAFEPPLCCGS